MEKLRQNENLEAATFRSKPMIRALRVIEAVAPKDVGLTFVGESGSGKELMARRAHQLSERSHGPFIPINCAAIPELLFESELFGHERGAFTGATRRVAGKIEAAEGGTLFLDEIGDMPILAQAKLLRFLENRRYMRVGGSTKQNANVRVMCATLRSLEKEVARGHFRADLFYRIQGITIPIPPLRERRGDIGALVALFTQRISEKHALQPPRLTRETKTVLLGYDWPGNVRELRNVIESLCLLRDGRRARVEDLPEPLALSREAFSGGSVETLEGGSPLLLTVNLADGLEVMNAQILQKALALEGQDPRKAAKLLKMSLRTVQRRIAAGDSLRVSSL